MATYITGASHCAFMHALWPVTQRYAAALGSAGSGASPASAMGAFSYSSGVTDHGEGGALAAALPGTPMQVGTLLLVCHHAHGSSRVSHRRVSYCQPIVMMHDTAPLM